MRADNIIRLYREAAPGLLTLKVRRRCLDGLTVTVRRRGGYVYHRWFDRPWIVVATSVNRHAFHVAIMRVCGLKPIALLPASSEYRPALYNHARKTKRWTR